MIPIIWSSVLGKLIYDDSDQNNGCLWGRKMQISGMMEISVSWLGGGYTGVHFC